MTESGHRYETRHSQGQLTDCPMEYQVVKFNRVVSATFKSQDLKIKDPDEGMPARGVFQAEGTARAKVLRQEHA